MSREIKFKAWDNLNKNMHEVNRINFTGRITVDSKLFKNDTRFLTLENAILLQYTGLKDKNGVDIYEGDIVQIKGHAFQKKPGDFTGIEIDGFYPVTYTERMELVAGQWLLMHQLPYITVVGNVYEHPHLLERD